MTRALHITWLVVVWLALWSDLSWANMASGLAVALLVSGLNGTWRKGKRSERPERPLRPLRALHLAGVFLVKLVESTVVVARTVLAPRARVSSGIVAVPLGGCSDALVTLIADLTSLTPGTLSVEIRRDPVVLYVHALHVREVEAVRRDVHRLALLAVDAFGDDQARTAIREASLTAYEGRT